MNQSPKKNKYIIKNQKLCSIPFLAIQPSSNTSSAHSKPLCSQQRRPPPARTAGNLHWQNLFQSRATSHRRYFRCHIFMPRQETSTWKPIICIPLTSFYSRAIQPCAFQEVSAKHMWAQPEPGPGERGRQYEGCECYSWQWKQVLVSMSLGCASQIMLLGSSRSTFGTSLTNQLFNCSPCLSTSSLEEGREQGGFSQNRDGIG